MSSNGASNNQNHSNKEGWKSISNYSITKPWGGMKPFMESYGLKIYNDEDIQEAKLIINEFKKIDWEEKNNNNANNK